ncbi:MAG: MBL fold metallo-hydrolase [Alphaproteobacteria bacterium]|jgi:phosphoribosyl 1,2-cyclic phosphodiesterase|nr:MBL fold metallo-hydrolase [Alphaproteobacteria bacterium]
MHRGDAIKVTFWGVRGSCPQCKPAFAKVGGHTSCVTLEVGDHYLIFDAGTGLIDAGDDMVKRGLRGATMLISHAHADHISGFAFFKPLHQPDFELTVIASGLLSEKSTSDGIEAVLGRVTSPPYFPVPWDQIACKRTCVDVPPHGQFSVGSLKVSTIPLDHPGGSAGYRVDIGDKSICYITDTSHTPGELNAELVEFIQRTDLLIYDATFTEEEFAAFPTWGHSTWNQAVALAKAAAIQDLALFHHNPEHDDAIMEGIEAEARSHFSRTFVARQGMTRVV